MQFKQRHEITYSLISITHFCWFFAFKSRDFQLDKRSNDSITTERPIDIQNQTNQPLFRFISIQTCAVPQLTSSYVVNYFWFMHYRLTTLNCHSLVSGTVGIGQIIEDQHFMHLEIEVRYSGAPAMSPFFCGHLFNKVQSQWHKSRALDYDSRKTNFRSVGLTCGLETQNKLPSQSHKTILSIGY